jgi:protein-S-isoprenylcysteine O-methyltransferase Ste14
MVKHGFVLGWVIAWFLIGYWKWFLEPKVPTWGSIIFFFIGLIFGTIVQTIMDRAEQRKLKREEAQENGSIYNHRY